MRPTRGRRLLIFIPGEYRFSAFHKTCQALYLYSFMRHKQHPANDLRERRRPDVAPSAATECRSEGSGPAGGSRVETALSSGNMCPRSPEPVPTPGRDDPLGAVY